MSNKNSSVINQSNGAKSIRLNRAAESQVEVAKRSIRIGDVLEHERSQSEIYREKSERNAMKCHFLFNKLTALGNFEGVPEMMATEISEVDLKIKDLQNKLRFKRSEQMKRLRQKVANFLEQINFDVKREDMDKIEDEIEIVLFLLDIFEEKFNQMTAERKEVNDIIARLQEDSTIHFQAEDEDESGNKEKSDLLDKVAKLEAELLKLKNEDMRKLESDLAKQYQSSSQNSNDAITNKNLELERANRKVSDLDMELKELRAKTQSLEGSLERVKREETRWKERYKQMQTQKDERIKMLEQSLSDAFRR